MSDPEVLVFGNRNLPEPTADRPLVTFALFAYNQEKYIREAVEGAFSQTYSPLEIILSDDCSSDRTFEIMQEMAAGYKGIHKVKLRKSLKNNGLISHINIASDHFEGDVVFMAAGDDISLPDRVVDCMSVVTDDVYAIFTDFSVLGSPDKHNETQDDWVEKISLFEITLNGGGIGKGATYAYRKECFSWPAPISTSLFSEDRILPLRASILGNVVYLHRRTVLYRDEAGSFGKALRVTRSLPFNHPPHIAQVLEHLINARLEKRISFLESLGCSWGVKSRFTLTHFVPTESKITGIIRRLAWRFLYMTFKILTPRRVSLTNLKTGTTT